MYGNVRERNENTEYYSRSLLTPLFSFLFSILYSFSSALSSFGSFSISILFSLYSLVLVKLSLTHAVLQCAYKIVLILQIPIQHVYTADFRLHKDPKNRQDKKIIAFTNSFKGLHSEDLTNYLILSEGFIKNCTVEILPATKHSLPLDNYR